MGYRFSMVKFFKTVEFVPEQFSRWVVECDQQPAHFRQGSTTGWVTTEEGHYVVSKEWCTEDDSFRTGIFSKKKFFESCIDLGLDFLDQQWYEFCEGCVCTFDHIPECGVYCPTGSCRGKDGIVYLISDKWCK